jgi:hypothetical protein
MKKLLLLFIITLFFINCTSVSTDDLTIPAPIIVSYTTNVKNIIDQSCATSGCHNATSNTAGLTLETFTQVKNAFVNRNALGRMESTTNPMPPNGNLPSTSIQTIKDWRDQGYLEN